MVDKNNDSIYYRATVDRIAKSALMEHFPDGTRLRPKAWASLKLNVPAKLSAASSAMLLRNLIKTLVTMGVLPNEECLLAAEVLATRRDSKYRFELRDWGSN